MITSFIVTNSGSGYTTAPTITLFPIASSGLYIGTQRTTFQSIQMTGTNSLMSRFWANRFAQFIEFCGRTTKLVAQNWYQPTHTSPDDRYTLESLASQTVRFGLGNGTNSITFTMNNNNIMETIEDSLPLADIYTQTLTVTSQWDSTYSPSDPAYAADMQLSFT